MQLKSREVNDLTDDDGPTIADSFALEAENQISSRTNFIIAANSFLLGAFATMAASQSITGALMLLPLIVSIAGIGLNIFLTNTNQNQAKRIGQSLRANSKFTETYWPKPDEILSGFNQAAPLIMIIIWLATIMVYGSVALKII
jgi:hypothetical protein